MYDPQPGNMYNGNHSSYPIVQQNPTGVPIMYNPGNYQHSTQTQPLLRPVSLPDQTYTIIIKSISGILSFAFLIAMIVLLGISRSENDRGACGSELWPLILVRIICNEVESLIMLVSGVSSPPLGPLMIMGALYKLAFAVAFTVVLPAAVSGGCTQVSSSWYALVVVSWIFLVVDWIGAVSWCCSSIFPNGTRQLQ